jgi:hypothetical protein
VGTQDCNARKERWSEVIKWRSLAMDYKRSARREATRFVESRISYREDNPIPGFSSLFNNSVLNFTMQNIRLRMVEQYYRHNSWLNILLDHKPFTWTILCYCLLLFRDTTTKKFRTYLNLSSSLWCCGWLVFHSKNTRVEPRLVSRCYLNFSTL